MEKPIKAKPMFYAACMPELQRVATEHGYNLLLHGSLNRDFDLVAVPWVNDPKPHIDLLNAFCDVLGVGKYDHDGFIANGEDFMFSILPGGRYSYVINLVRSGKFNEYQDSQYYLDISITPLQTAIE